MLYNLEDPVEKSLFEFQAVREKKLRKTFDLLPVLIVGGVTISSFARWYTQGVILWTYVSGGLAFVLSVLIMRELFVTFPYTLLLIWRRKMLHPIHESPDDSSIKELFLSFIVMAEKRLNSKVSYLFGFLLLIVTSWLIWLLKKESISALPDTFKSDPLAASISVGLLVIYCGAAFVGGVIGWRAIAIARQIRRFGASFRFDLQLEHPDGCGGLRPLGDLCLTLAYLSTPPLILVAGWLIIVNLGGGEQLYVGSAARIQAVVTTLTVLVFPFSILVLVSFFLPLSTIHTAMENSKLLLQGDLDQISQKINQLSIQLRFDAETLSPEQGQELEEKIDFLRRVYMRNNRIPTWPISADHLWHIASTQVVPVIGLGTSSIGFVKGIIEFIGKK